LDGTPEYSFHIGGLHKLLPKALFIHVFRDVTSVSPLDVEFHRVARVQLVADEEDAYRYWMRTVNACFLAERPYGPTVVHRIGYADLISEPESTMRSLLMFLAEASIHSNCASIVRLFPADFQADSTATNVEYMAGIDAAYQSAQQPIARLSKSGPPTRSATTAVP
jgi:sulfotransferase family protein